MTIVKSFVKSSLAIPKKEEAIIICPVEETGKNSVIPSITARRIACNVFIYACLGFFNMAYTVIPKPIKTVVGARRILLKLKIASLKE
jgi:hypothetical protein